MRARKDKPALQRHTQGRARIAIETGGCVVAVGDREILECYLDGEPQTLEDEENALRVVACWNACIGATNEELLSDAAIFARLFEELSALRVVAKKARKRLSGTNIMGQKLEAPLVAEIDAALKLSRGRP